MAGFLKTETVYIQNLSPYYNLWAAVLDQTVFDLTAKRPRSDVNKWKEAKQDALDWIESDAEYFNSFVNVCRILELDPHRTRRNVLANKDYVRKLRPKRVCMWCGKSYTKGYGKIENGLYVCNKCKKEGK